jgi:hypothetical protein
MVAPTCFGITLPSSGSVPSAFRAMVNWGAVDRILWMGVLCLVTWCVTLTMYLLVFHAYINKIYGSRSKILSKSLVRLRCAEGFNSGVEGLSNDHKVYHRWQKLTPIQVNKHRLGGGDNRKLLGTAWRHFRVLKSRRHDSKCFLVRRFRTHERADINVRRWYRTATWTGSKTHLFPGLAVTTCSGIYRGFKHFTVEGISFIAPTKDTNLFNHLKLQLFIVLQPYGRERGSLKRTISDIWTNVDRMEI